MGMLCVICFMLVVAAYGINENNDPYAEAYDKAVMDGCKMARVLERYKEEVGANLSVQWLNEVDFYNEFERNSRHLSRWSEAKERMDEYIDRFIETGYIPDQIPNHVSTPMYPKSYTPKYNASANLGIANYRRIIFSFDLDENLNPVNWDCLCGY